jgi:hypothetical protein
MPTFAPDDLTALANTYASLQKRFDALAQAYALLPYKTKNARSTPHTAFSAGSARCSIALKGSSGSSLRNLTRYRTRKP